MWWGVYVDYILEKPWFRLCRGHLKKHLQKLPVPKNEFKIGNRGLIELRIQNIWANLAMLSEAEIDVCGVKRLRSGEMPLWSKYLTEVSAGDNQVSYNLLSSASQNAPIHVPKRLSERALKPIISSRPAVRLINLIDFKLYKNCRESKLITPVTNNETRRILMDPGSFL